MVILRHHPTRIQPAVESRTSQRGSAARIPARTTGETRTRKETFSDPWDSPTENQVANLTSAIWRELNAPGGGDHDAIFDRLFPTLIALDPAAAIRLIAAAPAGRTHEELMRQLARTWTTKDPAAALAWAEQLTNSTEQCRTLIEVTKQLAETDPATAMTAVESHHLGDYDQSVMEDLAMVWSRVDLPGAQAWAVRLPAGVQRDEIISRIAFMAARTAPEEAARWVVANIPAGSVQTEAAISVLHQWAQQDFAAAKAWAEQFPPGSIHERAQAELANMTDKGMIR